MPEAPLLSTGFVLHCCETLSEKGFTRVVTGALSPLEQTGFLAAGFDVEAQLRLLEIDLTGPLPGVSPGRPLRRVSRRRQREVLDVDRAAFDEFWRFDEFGLRDALEATPEVRFRRAVSETGLTTGYAVCGRAGRRGFVQRLAVHPAAQGSGSGRRLLLDGLHWMRRRGAEQAVVNTQTDNQAAANLYLSVGFRDEPLGLSVLSAPL
jgi:mycothiol synthase